jgi:hypothetical protein
VQPIFHEDLGRIAAELAISDAAGVFAVGGSEVITMRELFEAIVQAIGGGRPVIPIPRYLCAFAAPALAKFGYTLDHAARIERDRVTVAQTPLPSGLEPRVRLAEGLSRLACAMGLSRSPDHGLAT